MNSIVQMIVPIQYCEGVMPLPLTERGHNSSKSITTSSPELHNKYLRLPEMKLNFGLSDFLSHVLIQIRLQIKEMQKSPFHRL